MENETKRRIKLGNQIRTDREHFKNAVVTAQDYRRAERNIMGGHDFPATYSDPNSFSKIVLMD
jgi:hypothetical protein